MVRDGEIFIYDYLFIKDLLSIDAQSIEKVGRMAIVASDIVGK